MKADSPSGRARLSGAARRRKSIGRPDPPMGTPEVPWPADLWPAGRCFPITEGEGRHRVWGMAVLTDRSLSVNLLGGEAPHIGAVAIGIPRPSLARAGRRSATTSVFALTGHKEDELARSMATILARRLGITSVVVAGIHLDRAGPGDIAAVTQNTDRALKAILRVVTLGARGKRRES